MTDLQTFFKVFNVSVIWFDSSALEDFKSHQNRGIGRFVRNFKNFAESLDIQVKFAPFCNPGPAAEILKFLPKGRDLIKNHVFYPVNAWLLTEPGDVIVIPSQTDAPFYLPRKYVLIVHDLIPWNLPVLYGKERNPVRYSVARFFEKNGIKNALHLIAISDKTKQDLIRVMDLSPDKVSVLYQGIDPIFCSRASEYIPVARETKRFLYYGGQDARKNTSLFIELARLFKDHEFVMIVDSLPKYELSPNLRVLRSCTDEQLVERILESDALIFPSLEEGFGLPVFETSALGRPVLASNIQPYNHIFGDSIFLFEPDVVSAKSCVERFLAAGREEIMARVASAQKIARSFSWEKTVRDFANLIDLIAREHKT